MNAQWCTGPYPADLPVKQIYALIFDAQGRLLLQDDGGRYNLPGGKPETGEDLILTLQRECLEESQVTMRAIQYLGYVRVGDAQGDYAQVRMVASLDMALPVGIDVATGKSYGRVMVEPEKAIALLGWGEHGRQQIEFAAWIFSHYMKRTALAHDIENLPAGLY
ncbi:NUDIX hydrolase [Massilia sp. P8910]|uniref:NUDIX domain-containing protein n=1 Tax=Massilia antarctica TaxID=2765360 RepID=UPI001E53CCE1|nr:NUDIX hydrolase [Massilia antarctica]MCE3607295.1 NUDIX hydrolase [Massilia antarctica]